MSLLTIALIFFSGLFLSAFFSGSETGFYRLNRIRLLFDARSGDRIASPLLWLTNHPTLFVASVLVGNNLANYLTSFAVVAAITQSPFATRSSELAATIAISPVVFVYGELLPKSLFFRAPNRLIRMGGPLMLVCVAVFSPIAGLLWGIGWLLQQWIGEAPLRVQQSVARHELQRLLQEGHEVGLLKTSQQHLSRNLFSVASRPVADFCAAAPQVLRVVLGDPKAPLLQKARDGAVSAAVVEDPTEPNRWLGYVRIVDLYLDPGETIDSIRSLPEVLSNESHLHALMHLQEHDEEMAQVLNANGEPLGVVFVEDLTEPLFRPA